jgi:hypothetical protein
MLEVFLNTFVQLKTFDGLDFQLITLEVNAKVLLKKLLLILIGYIHHL